jgi:hypothetical protein
MPVMKQVPDAAILLMAIPFQGVVFASGLLLKNPHILVITTDPGIELVVLFRGNSLTEVGFDQVGYTLVHMVVAGRLHVVAFFGYKKNRGYRSLTPFLEAVSKAGFNGTRRTLRGTKSTKDFMILFQLLVSVVFLSVLCATYPFEIASFTPIRLMGFRKGLNEVS